MKRPSLAILLLLLAALPALAAPPVEALPEGACTALRFNLETRLDAEAGFRRTLAAIDPDMRRAHGLDGTRCWLWARFGGYAVPTASLDALADRLSTAFLALGWLETEASLPFAADGPDGTAFARMRGKDTCVASILHEDFRAGPASARPHETAWRIDISCFRPKW